MKARLFRSLSFVAVSSATLKKTGFRIYLAGYFVLLFLLLMVGNQADLDLWGRMAMGALIHQNGAFPYRDVFSYTAPGAVWIDHEWGSGVLFYWTFLAWGSAGLYWLKVVVLGLVLLVLAGAQRARDRLEPGWSLEGPRYFVILFVLAATYLPLLVGFLSTVRCQIFSFLFYILFLWILEQFRLGTRPRLIWILPAIMVLWVNLHGGFSYGFVVLGLYLVWVMWARRWPDAKRLGGVIGLCVVATALNPYGITFYGEIVSAWLLKRPMIKEWGSIFGAYQKGFIVFYTGLLVLCVWVGGRDWLRDRKRFPAALLLILATAWQGYLHFKLMPFFVLTVGVFVPQFDLSFLDGVRIRDRWKPLAEKAFYFALPVAFLIAVTLVCVLQKLKFKDHFRALVSGPSMSTKYPVDAARFILLNKIKGNLWCDFNTGEFLFWTLYPSMKISIDGRYEEVYPKQVTDDYAAFFQGPDDVNVALKYPTTHILLPADRRDLAAKLEETGRWTLIYEDDLAKLYAKDFPKIPVEKSRSSGIVFMDYFRGDLSRFRLPPGEARKAGMD